jgi:hypothetical protein
MSTQIDLKIKYIFADHPADHPADHLDPQRLDLKYYFTIGYVTSSRIFAYLSTSSPCKNRERREKGCKG